MGIKEDYPEIVKKLVDLEIAVSKLYEQFAEKVPELKKFWDQLVTDERNHAHLLLTLTSDDAIKFNEQRFYSEDVDRYIDHVVKKTDTLCTKEITEIEALQTALGLECNIIESAFYAVFDGYSSQGEETIRKIARETLQHRNKISDLLEQRRQTVSE